MMYKKRFSMKEYFRGLLRDEHRRKAFIVSAVVFVVVFVGLTAYRQTSGETPKGDVIVTNSAGIADENGSVQGDSNAESIPDESALNDGSANTENAVHTSNGDGAAIDNDTDKAGAAIFIDVGGAVQVGGLFALPAGSRVADAIEAAGGLTEEADMKYLNRAAVLVDGDRLYVPTENELLEGTAPPTAGQVTGGGSGSSFALTPQGKAGSGLVNINTAGSEELQTLNGVGPSTAQKIIDYRTNSGGFGQIEDLMNVSGIGAKTFDKLKQYITV